MIIFTLLLLAIGVTFVIVILNKLGAIGIIAIVLGLAFILPMGKNKQVNA